MPIVTSPVTINDGTADHIFSFRAQLPDPKLVIAEYIEAAATEKVRSRITVKHDDRNGKVIRRLISRTRMCVSSVDASVYHPVTVNLTATYHPDCTIAEVQKDIVLVRMLVAIAGTPANFLQGQV